MERRNRPTSYPHASGEVLEGSMFDTGSVTITPCRIANPYRKDITMGVRTGEAAGIIYANLTRQTARN